MCRQLGLLLDNNGLIRCCGRLQNAELNHGSRMPKLLPPKDAFTRLVILDIHSKVLHSGTSQTLAALRHEYWVPRGRSTIQTLNRHCTVCKRFESSPFKMPKMPPLPKERVSQSPPFTFTGLDYLGPLYVKSEYEKKKVWVCLFTCLAVRAIHLEMVDDMSSDKFLLCFRRFVAIHGKPKRIISDNASQFKLARSVIDKVWTSMLTKPDVQNYMTTHLINWHFTVELAPWMGGFYERLVGIVKRNLRKSIGRVCLTRDQLQTTLVEVQSIENSRPLVYVDEDINSQISLTPNHFIRHNQQLGVPNLDFDNDPDFQPRYSTTDKLLSLWKKGQKHLNKFWEIWRNDYLLSLRERHKTHLTSPRVQHQYQPNIGDVVLLKDNLPRAACKLGRIVKFQTSLDGEIRSAEIKLPSKVTINRPLNLLYPLECAPADAERLPDSTVSTYEETKLSPRPTRKAAMVARDKLKLQLA